MSQQLKIRLPLPTCEANAITEGSQPLPQIDWEDLKNYCLCEVSLHPKISDTKISPSIDYNFSNKKLSDSLQAFKSSKEIQNNTQHEQRNVFSAFSEVSRASSPRSENRAFDKDIPISEGSHPLSGKSTPCNMLTHQTAKASANKHPKRFSPKILKISAELESEVEPSLLGEASENTPLSENIKGMQIMQSTPQEIADPKIVQESKNLSLGSSDQSKLSIKLKDILCSPKNTDSTNTTGIKRFNKFQVRMDVVSKTIFRQVKAYYVSEFKKAFDFTKRRKRVNPDHSAECYKQAEKFVLNFFGTNMENLSTVFLALVDSKQKFCKPSEKFPGLKMDINSLLRSYNTRRAEKLIKIPEFSFLTREYLKREESLKEVLRGLDHPKLVEAYKSKISELSTTCGQVLN